MFQNLTNWFSSSIHCKKNKNKPKLIKKSSTWKNCNLYCWIKLTILCKNNTNCVELPPTVFGERGYPFTIESCVTCGNSESYEKKATQEGTHQQIILKSPWKEVGKMIIDEVTNWFLGAKQLARQITIQQLFNAKIEWVFTSNVAWIHENSNSSSLLKDRKVEEKLAKFTAIHSGAVSILRKLSFRCYQKI